MEKFQPLLLDIWGITSRHLEISEAVRQSAPILARQLPIDLVLVRSLDLAESQIVTVGSGSFSPRGRLAPQKFSCHPEQLERLLSWGARQSTWRADAVAAQTDLPGLVPENLNGSVLAGPLRHNGDFLGALILVSTRTASFEPEHCALFEALLEPFSVALSNSRQLQELTRLREAAEASNRSLLSRLDRRDISDSIVGSETGLREVIQRIELVSRSDAPVLLFGETGSGKEVAARAIHARSARATGPFLRVNCGAIPPELVDSQLFGHERGSFTGAIGSRKGWFERADGGTLFLDEIGELPPAAQVRLLRILQDGTFERVGGQQQLSVDVRVVAATHHDLKQKVNNGSFREDLWYRIAVFPIVIPPLRDRTEDIPALATHFALRAAKNLGVPSLAPSPGDIERLVAYPWPGNIRELSAVIERAVILGNGRFLAVAQALGIEGAVGIHASRSGGEADPPSPAPKPFSTLDEAMRKHIEAALQRTRGRVEGPAGAARLLGINPHTLRARMRKLGIDWAGFRAGDGGL